MYNLAYGFDSPYLLQLRLFRSSHNYAKATARHYSSFKRNQEDEYQRVYLVWGLKPADISACDQKSGDYCFGNPQYDSTFNMNTAEAQIAFKVMPVLKEIRTPCGIHA